MNFSMNVPQENHFSYLLHILIFHNISDGFTVVQVLAVYYKYSSVPEPFDSFHTYKYEEGGTLVVRHLSFQFLDDSNGITQI